MRIWQGSSPAFTFVFTMGIVNLFGDVTYEGGGSINGPFMATLGASAAVVSITAGAGEFLGYALRPFSGYLADKSGRYWLITFILKHIRFFRTRGRRTLSAKSADFSMSG